MISFPNKVITETPSIGENPVSRAAEVADNTLRAHVGPSLVLLWESREDCGYLSSGRSRAPPKPERLGCVAEEGTPAGTACCPQAELREKAGRGPAGLGCCSPWGGGGSPWRWILVLKGHFNLSACAQASEQQRYLAIGLLRPPLRPTSRTEVAKDSLALRAVHFA